jgi:hypothetical protein
MQYRQKISTQKNGDFLVNRQKNIIPDTGKSKKMG